MRRAERENPAAKLAEAHAARLLVEDRLREALVAAGLVIDAEHVAPTNPDTK